MLNIVFLTSKVVKVFSNLKRGVLMDRHDYLEAVKDALEELIEERGRFWERGEEVRDQIRTIKELAFLKDKRMRVSIEEKMDGFHGDKWKLVEELVEFLYAKGVELPPAKILATLILYIFYVEKPLDLSVVER